MVPCHRVRFPPVIKLLIAVVAIALAYWIYRLKKQHFFVRHKSPEPVITTLEGAEVRAFLDWDTPTECLRDDGLRCGEQFRAKQPPDLPHSERCQCEAVKLFYTSAEVFQGTSTPTSRKSGLGELPGEVALVLRLLLLELHDSSTKESFTKFWGRLGVERIPDEWLEPMRQLLSQTHDALHRTPESS